jgi:hypothetical protein
MTEEEKQQLLKEINKLNDKKWLLTMVGLGLSKD